MFKLFHILSFFLYWITVGAQEVSFLDKSLQTPLSDLEVICQKHSRHIRAHEGFMEFALNHAACGFTVFSIGYAPLFIDPGSFNPGDLYLMDRDTLHLPEFTVIQPVINEKTIRSALKSFFKLTKQVKHDNHWEYYETVTCRNNTSKSKVAFSGMAQHSSLSELLKSDVQIFFAEFVRDSSLSCDNWTTIYYKMIAGFQHAQWMNQLNQMKFSIDDSTHGDSIVLIKGYVNNRLSLTMKYDLNKHQIRHIETIRFVQEQQLEKYKGAIISIAISDWINSDNYPAIERREIKLVHQKPNEKVDRMYVHAVLLSKTPNSTRKPQSSKLVGSWCEMAVGLHPASPRP